MTIRLMAHDFNTDLGFEHSKFAVQDAFYLRYFGSNIRIDRIGFDSQENQDLQRHDIDLIITLGNGKRISISEKHRKNFYGDILIECYSKFPDVLGWMDNSDADYMAYFVPGQVVMINKRQLVDFYKQHLKSNQIDNIFANLIKNNPRRSQKFTSTLNIYIKERNLNLSAKLTFIQAYNHPYGSSDEWYTESIAVPLKILDAAGVNYKIIEL